MLGRLLGTAFVLCFLTGLYSHFLQQPLPWMRFPTHPFWLYQVTQGVHITTGIACFPLLLGKLYAVFPKLFQTPPVSGFLHFLERASITLFVSAAVIELTIGLLDTLQWYPFPFYFKQTHFALAFVVVGSLAIHIGAKLPVIRRYWWRRSSYDEQGGLTLAAEDEPVTSVQVRRQIASGGPPTVSLPRRAQVTDRIMAWIDSAPPREPSVSRRGFLVTLGGAVAALVVLTAGQSFAVLDPVNLFAPRKEGIGPDSVPVNRTAKAAQVLQSAVSPDWSLTVRRAAAVKRFSRADLLAREQASEVLPIACVEGWSQYATWSGVRLRDLMREVGWREGEELRVTSLEKKGDYRVSTMGSEYVEDDRTLVALRVNGEQLDIDHGYPARMIAPGRPGVLQTKWLDSLEVM